MPALEAARIGDEIGHTSALAGLLIGAVAAAAIAVAVVAIVGTGGMAAVAIGAGIAAATAGGALGGASIGALIPTSPTGAILTGSFDVFIGTMPAARAGLDTAACSGVVPLFPHATPLIAQGSTNVFTNGMMAARRTDKLVCGAAIAKGCPTVFIGGGTATVPGLTIDSDVPGWLSTALWVVVIAGTVIATGGAVLAFGWGAAIGGLLGGLTGGYLGAAGGGYVGGKIGGYFGNAELGERIGSVAGGFLGSLAGGFAGGKAGGKLFPEAPQTVPVSRLPQDVAVDPNPPRPLSLNRPVGSSAAQNAQVQADIAAARAQGATDFRVNQQQVNAAGQRVGVNRPDLQYTDANGQRVYIEYDTPNSNRGPIHEDRLLANDPNSTVILKVIP
jgi:uncharacterized Zn-binding protein involved in type VI secretion